tara:strand:- start:49 stop:900 length:852 start_codon:yes stop_codon:yes gene_type:complete
MISVVGLGGIGCKIADKFSEWSNYKVWKIDSSELPKGVRNKTIKNFKEPELFEMNFPALGSFFKNINKEVIVVLSGASLITGGTLRVLEELVSKKGCKVDIVYVKPDIEILSIKKRLQENLTRNVLQQYTRSGLLNKMFLYDNILIEKTIKNLTLNDYFDRINYTVAYYTHMLNVFDNTDPVMSTLDEFEETVKLFSVGIFDTEKNEENMLFPLKNVKEKRYYWNIPTKQLEEDVSLVQKIRDRISSENDEIVKTFAVFKSSHDVSHGICLEGTNITQDIEIS